MGDTPSTSRPTQHDPPPPRIFEPDYYERMRRLEDGSWWNAGMRDLAARMLSQLELPARGTVLDVGCGSGQTMRWALQLLGPGWNAIGLDVAIEGVAAARASGLSAIRASALCIPLPAASVDLVITLDVLQHLPLGGGDVTALREMRRVLKPGGALFVRTNAQSVPRTRDDPDFNFRKYEPASLRSALVAGGFQVRRLSRINALLGLAEIPRELRASRKQGRDGYHGLLALPAGAQSWTSQLKRRWLTWEGRIVSAGLPLPAGRTIVALAVRSGEGEPAPL